MLSVCVLGYRNKNQELLQHFKDLSLLKISINRGYNLKQKGNSFQSCNQTALSCRNADNEMRVLSQNHCFLQVNLP